MKIYRIHLVLLVLVIGCQSSISEEKVISNDEYDVITTSILHLNVSEESEKFRLSDSTSYDEEGVKEYLKLVFPEYSEQMIRDFVSKNTKRHALDSTKFKFESPPQLLRMKALFDYVQAKNRNNQLEHKDYTMSYYFSRVGFNSIRRKAIISIAQICGGLCGNGYYLFLEKENGIWNVVKKNHLWFS